MTLLVVTFLVSTLLTLWVVRTAHHHAHLSGDTDTSGPQKFHQGVVPRIGGVGIFAGVAVPILCLWWMGKPEGRIGALLLLCGLPAFVAGIVEDVTKQVSPGKRLVATFASALLASWLLGATLPRADVPGVDWLMGFTAVAVVCTAIAVAGVANSVNIIDGFNGLASMCVMLMLAGFGLLAYMADDKLVAHLCLFTVVSVAGFFVWNYPRGLVFLGDGGAYFLGFWVAEMGVLLVVRNPEMSPLAVLLVVIYPVFETIFSIYRRRFLKAVPPGLPDGIHLHSLIYRRLVRWAAGPRDSRSMTARNSAVSPYLWTLCLFSLVPAVLFWNNKPMLTASIFWFGLTYWLLYWRIVRFRTPGFMRQARTALTRLVEPPGQRQSKDD
jgi:UDP-N-acetylmuramyl pentapeptide phosphotransferase/UDP-N-acetylglucosamine-1-phosphate transferase